MTKKGNTGAASGAGTAQGYDVATIAKVLGISPRRVQQLAKDGMPTLARGRYPLVPCVHWYVKFWQDRAQARVATGAAATFDEARARKTEAEATLSEIELEAVRGRLIPREVHEERVEQLATRLASKLKNMNRYVGDVQSSLTSVDAQSLLERIGDDLLRALHGVAEEIETAAEIQHVA